jgi:hypothetical protein
MVILKCDTTVEKCCQQTEVEFPEKPSKIVPFTFRKFKKPEVQ